ncbi:hypothetical protein J6590_073964 [Homalodisca vitripennis]|nr:hypothetical protein J6590_073964 [Homalodisca vitripennis]
MIRGKINMRGLLHAHIVFKIDGYGPVQAPEIDTVIRAEIPSVEEAGGRLRKLVLQHMIHGPCGTEYRTDFPCWDSTKGWISSKCHRHIFGETIGRGRTLRDEENDGKHFVTARQRGEKVCRLCWISPNRGELYYIRMLLMSIPCRGYSDLLSRGGPDCRTFQEVCRQLGFVEHEDQRGAGTLFVQLDRQSADRSVTYRVMRSSRLAGGAVSLVLAIEEYV